MIRKLSENIAYIFVKNGIPADIAMKIIIELGNILNKEENE